MSVIGGQNPIVQDGLVYILDFGNDRSYTSGSNSAQSLIYNPVTASFTAPLPGVYDGLAAAYSVRKVVPGYAGDAMEVQSGSVSASIGFDSLGNLDTASLESFAGSGDAFVKTWYDQSGNGFNAVANSESEQPQIVLSGVTIKTGSIPALQLDGTDRLNMNNLAGRPLLDQYFVAATSDTNYQYPARGTNKPHGYYAQNSLNSEKNTDGYGSPSLGVNGDLYTIPNTYGGRKQVYDLLNGYRLAVHQNPSTSTWSIYNFGPSYAGLLQELIAYTSSQANNRPYLEANINSYYGIYTSSFSPTPGFDTNKIDLSRTVAVDTNQSFPGFSYDQGNLTLIFTGETKTNSPLFTQADQISVLGTTSSIGYGLPGNSGGRTFPASGFDHISLRFTTGSVDCFVNGIPTAPNSIFPTGSFGTGDFIASNYSGSLGNLLVYNRELTDDEIYDTYLQQARRYGLPETVKPYSVDSSVYAYTQAAGITGSAVISALDAFVSGLKANGLWNKMIAIYPFLGSDTIKTRYNLKDPSLNTTAVTYSGSWSASDSGSYNDNTSSYGIMENIKGDYYHPLISSESIHLSYLSYDTPASGGYLMGVEETPGLPGDIAAPAAAYSVRKVRTAYTGSAMNIRRDFDDVTFDVGFDGSGNLDTGSLLTNMTASGLTETLPGDYSGLAAAYSLRKVSSSYYGPAIEVRKDSNDASGSIGFDGSGGLNTGSLLAFLETGSEVPVDTYSGLSLAYSLRQVSSSYSGDAIEIQSGSVSQSIGFDSFGNLDVAAIKSFAGSGDAFVKTWYDQSGNGNHGVQSNVNSQPKIYDGVTGVVTENGKPAVLFDSTTYFSFTNSITFGNDANAAIVLKATSTSTAGIFAVTGDGNAVNGMQLWNQGLVYRTYNTGTDDVITDTENSENKYAIIQFGRDTSATSYMQINGILQEINANSQDTNARNYYLGTIYTDRNFYVGTIQEFIIYDSNQASNRTYIENNINSYYGIYTPDSVSTDSAYVKTWYDQSGNNNHASQSVTSRQPLIVSSGSLITENGKPALSFDGSSDGMIINTPITTVESTVNITANVKTPRGRLLSSNTSNGFFWFSGGTAANLIEINYSGGTFTTGSNTAYINNQSLFTFNSTPTGYTLHIDGDEDINQVESVSSFNIQNIGYNGSDQWTRVDLQEVIFYTSSQTTNRGLIEDNINGYYNIFTHSLDSGSGYVTTWYDQSGNDYHAVQATAASQPLILSSGSIVTEGGKSALSFDGNDDFLSIPSLTNTNSNSVFHVVKLDPHEGINAEFPFSFNNDRVYYAQSPGNRLVMASNAGSYVIPGVDILSLVLNSFFWSSNGSAYQNGTVKGSSLSFTPLVGTFTGFIGNALTNRPDLSARMVTHELLYYTSSQTGNRQPIEQDINSYFNIYTPPGYNLNTNSLSLFSDPTTVAGAANNVTSASFTTGGPLGLITVTRTGSSDYTLWKNRVPTKTTLPASVPLSNEIYLNAANLDNALFSASQNTAAYVSVGAGLTDDEVYTYYELVDDLQTSLDRGPVDPDAFITVWDTRITANSAENQIILPLIAGTQAITASWGDGTQTLISSSAQVDKTHSYDEPGIYTVTVTGESDGFFDRYSADKAKLLDIVQWGNVGAGLTDRTFSGCSNLIGTYTDTPEVNISNARYTFENCTKFNGWVNDWDMTSVSSLQQFFKGSSFNQPLDEWVFRPEGVTFNLTFSSTPFNQDIGAWDVTPVTSFGSIFPGSPFNNGGSPSINNWTPVSCSNFSGMFSGTPFNQPIGGWELGTGSQIPSTGINMSSMFASANSFNQYIGDWNVEKVTNMALMFNGVQTFNQDIGNWNVENVTSFNSMFGRSGRVSPAFNNGGSPNINNWRPISCSDFNSMFYNAPAFNQPIGNWPLSASNIDMGRMFNGNNGITNFNQNIGAWDVSRVISMESMFFRNRFNNSGSADINNWRPISCSNFGNMFYDNTVFNQPIGGWELGTGSQIPSTGISMGSMFRNADAFNQNIGSWNVEKVTAMNNMFQSNGAFNNSGSADINNWRPISCSNFTSMFQSATAFNQPIGGWQLPTASNIAVTMSNMFRDAFFNQPLGSWDMSNVTDINSMFRGNLVFNQNVGSWDVSKITNMQRVFQASRDFNNAGSPDINNWVPISCSDFSYMFNSTVNFNQPLGDWDIRSATTMANMFDSSGIDIPNYTKTLRGWGDLANSTGVQTAVPLGASGKKYGAAHAQRKVLTDTYGWTITDGGQEPFVFTINTTASGYTPGTELTFTLPILDANTGSYALDILVDWGDSSVSSISSSAQPEITHSYSNSGSYEITITGSLTGFGFNNGGDRKKLTDVSKWSALELNSYTRAFLGCSNLIGTATDAPFISTNNFSKLFQAASNFTGEIGNWDVSNVTSMGDMFDGAGNFNADLSNWDVSNVTNTSVMFRGSGFDNGGSPGINNWNTHKFQNLDSMFNNAQAFNQDIGNWNMSSATVLSNFMVNKSNYNHLDSIYNNWPNYKLKPNLTNVNFGGNQYTAAGAAGRALLTGSYASASIQFFNVSSSGGTNYYTIQTTTPHLLQTGSRFTLTGSDNAVLNKAHTVTSVISSDTIGIDVPYTASTSTAGAFIYTGYGWTITDGGQI